MYRYRYFYDYFIKYNRTVNTIKSFNPRCTHSMDYIYIYICICICVYIYVYIRGFTILSYCLDFPGPWYNNPKEALSEDLRVSIFKCGILWSLCRVIRPCGKHPMSVAANCQWNAQSVETVHGTTCERGRPHDGMETEVILIVTIFVEDEYFIHLRK